MTSRKPDDEEAVVDLGELSEALGTSGELIPETEEEVRLAEEQISEESIELPPGLAQYRPPRGERSEPLKEASESAIGGDSASTAEGNPPARWGVVVPFFAAGAGFAVAAAVLLALVFPKWSADPPPIAGTPDEVETDPVEEEPIELQLVEDCADCCAGPGCAGAEADLKQCASGRTCVPCSADDQQNAYKIRVSALHVRPEEEAWFEKQKLKLHELQICALSKGKPLGCRPAGEAPEDLLYWSSLPTASTRDQLVGGVELRLVSRERGTLAEWKNSVLMSTETLCRGVAANLTAEASSVGRVSMFFDDAYFVEIARGETVAEAQKLISRIRGMKERLSVYKTTEQGNRTFALVVGPLARKPAEKLRWQMLDQGVRARITFGEDHEGERRPAD